MTIDQAIRILTHYDTDLDAWNEEDTDTAIKLGIEALTWIYELRGIVKSLPPDKLPGETKE